MSATDSTADGRIFVLDEIVVQPGRASEYRDFYLAQYAPGARARGMQLESVRMTPPFELTDGANTLQITWSLDHVGAWWAMRGAAGADPAVHAFWHASGAMIVSRSRRFFTDASAPR